MGLINGSIIFQPLNREQGPAHLQEVCRADPFTWPLPPVGGGGGRREEAYQSPWLRPSEQKWGWVSDWTIHPPRWKWEVSRRWGGERPHQETGRETPPQHGSSILSLSSPCPFYPLKRKRGHGALCVEGSDRGFCLYEAITTIHPPEAHQADPLKTKAFSLGFCISRVHK